MRLLLVSPSFFGYEQAVANEFRRQGHEVDLLDERPSNQAWARALVRVAPALLARRVSRHYDAFIKQMRPSQYDALLVIKGEVVPRSFLDAFIRLNPSAARAYYTFDSLANSPQGVRLLDLFTHRYTFDRSDAGEQPQFAYKPLFYAREYTYSDEPRTLDISFVGTLHSDRYEFARRATASIPADRSELFFYIPAAWYFWLRKMVSSQVRPIGRREVNTTPLTRADTIRLTQRSRAVLDLQRPGQVGLTMRTFETLATGTALVTANPAITQEPFYDPHTMLVVPADPEQIDPAQVLAFIADLPEPAAPQGFERYSLNRWVEDLAADLGRDRSTADRNNA